MEAHTPDDTTNFVLRTSVHACKRCGAMVALDLIDRHEAWHRELDERRPGEP